MFQVTHVVTCFGENAGEDRSVKYMPLVGKALKVRNIEHTIFPASNPHLDTI